MTRIRVSRLVSEGVLLVEDGNHGEYRPRPAEFVVDGVPFIRAADMSSGVVDFEGAGRINGVARARIRKGIGAPGDVILSHKGTVGRIAVAPKTSPDFVCSPQTTFWRSLKADALDQRFLRYLMASDDFRRQLDVLKGQTDMAPYVSLSDQRSMEVELPHIDEQRAVADLLGALDDKIAANGRAAKIAFELARSLVGSVLSSQDSLVQCKFGALGQLFDGPHATPTRRSDGPYFLNISSLKCGRLDLADSDHVSEQDFAEWTRRVTPEAGDLLFSYETRIGEAAMMPGGLRACLGRRMALMRPNRAIVDPGFLLHFYLSAEFQRVIAMHTIHGATVPRIGLATMPEWGIAIPDLEAQRPIAGALGSLHSTMVQAERESEDLARTRDELLPLLMSGKLRVKDAEAVAAAAL
ncbi:restriction endonuclease subunit S [Mycobacterium sp.]|uniref:restriction endonuclease subunit S n=1 Tax=Mycobacterium sp. TaxID=1785 RepID=UPI002C70DD69|nr:restriction endonuclease subunit S [Mycobacterium sp.]HTQ18315.1 restriction endonuclease subunit S [Mycobacterium sp.]